MVERSASLFAKSGYLRGSSGVASKPVALADDDGVSTLDSAVADWSAVLRSRRGQSADVGKR